MKALTVRQPWASLIVHGPKHIETRSKPTKIRGRIGIIAGKSPAGIRGLPGDCEGNTEGDWQYGYLGPYQAGYCYRSADEGDRGDTFLALADGMSPVIWDPKDIYEAMPLGALIGTVELYDCVPIWDGLTEMEDYEDVGFRIVAEPPYGAWMYAGPDDRVGTDVANQIPYGDFATGRWAWLLRDPQPLAEPIPMRGAQHWQEVEL